MTEVLGTVASGIAIAQLAGAVVSTTQKIYIFWKEMKDAPKHIGCLLVEIELLGEVLVEYYTSNRQGNGIYHHSTTLEKIYMHCETAIKDLDEVLETLDKGLKKSGSKAKKIWYTFRVVMKGSVLEDLMERLERAKSMLNLASQCHMMSIRRTKGVHTPEPKTPRTEYEYCVLYTIAVLGAVGTSQHRTAEILDIDQSVVSRRLAELRARAERNNRPLLTVENVHRMPRKRGAKPMFTGIQKRDIYEQVIQDRPVFPPRSRKAPVNVSNPTNMYITGCLPSESLSIRPMQELNMGKRGVGMILMSILTQMWFNSRLNSYTRRLSLWLRSSGGSRQDLILCLRKRLLKKRILQRQLCRNIGQIRKPICTSSSMRRRLQKTCAQRIGNRKGRPATFEVFKKAYSIGRGKKGSGGIDWFRLCEKYVVPLLKLWLDKLQEKEDQRCSTRCHPGGIQGLKNYLKRS
ncbi:Ankyrin repeat-containing domain protein [Rutstroemia sp. NJR-2017a WRK4]|nr:Ankyrin repeat-containing domain protein [Rutstroemia sp. NJR-2017a WRK4]